MKSQYDEELEESRKIWREAQDKTLELAELRSLDIMNKFKDISDEELLSDFETLKFLFAESYSATWAHRRVEQLCETNNPNVKKSGVDGRDEFFGFPCIQIMLDENQDITDVAQTIREFFKKFALGREEVSIGILEYDLSLYASWSITYDVKKDTGKINQLRYGHNTIVLEGSLESVLEWAAKNRPYQRENDEYEDYDE